MTNFRVFKEPLVQMLLGSLLITGSTTAAAQNSAGLFDPDQAGRQAEQDRVRRESTGLLGGMVVGGLVGGPAGAIFTGVAGALLGNHLSHEEERAELRAGLDASRRQVLALQEEKRELERRYQLALEPARESRLVPAGFSSDVATAASPCCSDAALSLHFRTDSSEIETHYLEQLGEFVRLVRQLPDAVVQVIGYADRRGQANRNLELSRLRVQAVERALRELGLGEAAVQAVAVGENRPVADEASLEGHFFDRRVDLRVSTQNGELLTGLAE